MILDPGPALTPAPSHTGLERSIRCSAASPQGRTWRRVLSFVGLIVWATGLGSAQSISEYPTPGGGALRITQGPDGTLWFTEQYSNRIARITTSGVVTEFSIPTPNSSPVGIATGSDGALWFTEQGASKVGRVTVGGAFSEFAIAGFPETMTAGPDGNVWFVDRGANMIGRITTAGTVSEFPIPTPASASVGITAGPDGALWFTESAVARIGRITTAGAVTEFSCGARPADIVTGPDGALWFAENSGAIGRMTTAGSFTEFPVSEGAHPFGITSGPDGNLWFTETEGRVGRMTPSGTFSEFATPTSNSNPLGITVGPDGNIWFAEFNAFKIGTVSLAPVVVHYGPFNLPNTAVGGQTTFLAEHCHGTGSSNCDLGGTVTGVSASPMFTTANFRLIPASEYPFSCFAGTPVTIPFSYGPNQGVCFDVLFRPTTSGPVTGAVTVSESGRQYIWDFTATAVCPLMTFGALPSSAGAVGLPYNGDLSPLSVSGGTAPYRFAVTGNLPPGLTLGSTTGVLTGTPTSQGTYSFTITATDAYNCAGSQSYNLPISYGPVQTPIAGFAAPASARVNEPVTFTDTSTNFPISWSWTFGDGGIAAVRNPVHTFTSEGTYNVQLTVANTAGTSAPFAAAIRITPPPPPSAAAFCAPSGADVDTVVGFSDESSGSPTAWAWEFGDGAISSLQNPTHVYTAPNTYEVRLTVTNDGGSTSSAQRIAISPPTADLPEASFCAPSSEAVNAPIRFTDTSTHGPTSWFWSFGDGGTSTEQSPTHVYATSNNQTVRLTVTNRTGSNQYGGVVHVTPPVAPAANFVVSPTPPGAGQSIDFTDTSKGGPTTWSWSFGDGTTSTAQSPTKAYGAPGTYTVSLAISNSAGSSSKSQVVTVTSCVGNETTLCLGNGRFRVTAEWTTSTSAGHGNGVRLTPDTGYFWFFTGNNVELLVKVLDGRAFNGRFWVFYGALSDVHYTITVTDTQTGEVRTYANPSGHLASVADTAAFPTGGGHATISEKDAELDYARYAAATGPETSPETPPETERKTAFDATAGCTPGKQTLCLGAARFRAQVAWQVPSQGTSGAGQAILQTDDTGYFWFFSSNNVELVIKVLDGRAFNGRFWVFYGALSDVQYTITVTDTSTGAVRTYHNPSGHLASVADTSAF